MASLQEIKARLNSIATTKKITKAMQLVATAKLQKAQKNLKSIQEYYTSVKDLFEELFDQVEDIKLVLPKTDSKKTLYILITSDMGLCGAYNSNVLKIAKSEMQEGDEIIVLGTKGVLSFNHSSFNPKLALPKIGDEPNYQAAQKTSKEAMAAYLSGEVKSIKLIHTEFINTVTYNATVSTLLPLVKNKEEAKIKTNKQADFEPDVEAVVKGAMPLYFSAMLYGTMAESKVSEMSSRRVAMENATDNAEEIIEHLDIQYNRARQSAITQEINEIIAGSDS